MSDSVSKFSCFNQVPWKLVRHRKIIRNGKIKPLHIRIYPTNRCNTKCSWCCYKNDDRESELSTFELRSIIYQFKKLGTEAITWSGGGEPTIHSGLRAAICYAYNKGIDCGLITNGLKWSSDKYADDSFMDINKALKWMRVSVIDTESGNYNDNIIKIIAKRFPEVAVGISFVVTKDVCFDTAMALCEIANKTPNITHIKFIQDSYNLQGGSDVALCKIEELCSKITDKGIYIHRDKFTEGADKCYVSLLKPVIAADGSVFPCCDVQHAIEDVHYNPSGFRISHWREFADLTKPFDGSECLKCYYDNYNHFLDQLTEKGEHDKFL